MSKKSEIKVKSANLAKNIAEQNEILKQAGVSREDYLKYAELERTQASLERLQINRIRLLEEEKKRIEELNKNAWKENPMVKAWDRIQSEKNSQPTQVAANYALALATGGLINPLVAQQLHLDKFITTPITMAFEKIMGAGFGHKMASGIKDDPEKAEQTGLLRRIAKGVEGLGKSNKTIEEEKKKEDGLFSTLIKAAAGIMGTSLLLSNLPGIPDWVKDYLPWAVGGFIFGGIKGLAGAVILKAAWNLFQEHFGDVNSILNTADTADTALNKFAAEIGVSSSTVKIALGGAIAGLWIGGIKGALAGAILALAGNAFWSAYKTKETLEKEVNNEPVETFLRFAGQTESEHLAQEGADEKTIENTKNIEDAIKITQNVASVAVLKNLLRHPLHPKGMSPYLTYAAGAIETAAAGQRQIDKNNGNFDGIAVGNGLIGEIYDSWQDAFGTGAEAFNNFSEGEILSGSWNSIVALKKMLWDSFLMGIPKFGGSLGSYVIGAGQETAKAIEAGLDAIPGISRGQLKNNFIEAGEEGSIWPYMAVTLANKTNIIDDNLYETLENDFTGKVAKYESPQDYAKNKMGDNFDFVGDDNLAWYDKALLGIGGAIKNLPYLGMHTGAMIADTASIFDGSYYDDEDVSVYKQPEKLLNADQRELERKSEEKEKREKNMEDYLSNISEYTQSMMDSLKERNAMEHNMQTKMQETIGPHEIVLNGIRYASSPVNNTMG